MFYLSVVISNRDKYLLFPLENNKIREVCCVRFLLLKIQKYCCWGMKPMINTIFPSMKLQPKEKIASFHDALRYLTCQTEVKSFFQLG